MKFYLNIESEDGENLAEFTAPTFELLSEKVGAWERAQKLVEPIDTGLVCQYCGSAEDEDTEVMTKSGGDESMDICEGCYDNMFA